MHTEKCNYCNGRRSLEVGLKLNGQWIVDKCTVCEGTGTMTIEEESEDE